MASSRRGLVAPQNTFIDNIGRKAASQGLPMAAVTFTYTHMFRQ